MGTKIVSAADAAKLVGVEEAGLIPYARGLIETSPPRYHVAEDEDYDSILANIVRALARRKFEPVGPHRKQVWERGWSENLQAFIASNYDVETLRPFFMHSGRPFRLQGQFTIGETPDVEFQISRFIRSQFFGTWFTPVDAVFEFGAGTGANILELNRLFPQKPLCGLDWTQASVDTMKNLHAKLTPLISGRLFDFLDPDYTLKMPPNAGVLTSGALEQIGDKFEPFVRYLLAKKPRVVVHMEPILEYYREDSFFDVLASEYHRQRDYLHGLVPHLRALQKAGKLRILSEHRTEFGSLYDEGYSLIVWEPM